MPGCSAVSIRASRHDIGSLRRNAVLSRWRLAAFPAADWLIVELLMPGGGELVARLLYVQADRLRHIAPELLEE